MTAYDVFNVLQREDDLVLYVIRLGYAVRANGGRVFFPIGQVDDERVRPCGRISYLLVTYDDGSRLEYGWNEECGVNLEVLPPLKEAEL